ncbi:MAG: type IV secretion system DNA-binding domain-containing protein [Pseudomonadota bacterium]
MALTPIFEKESIPGKASALAGSVRSIGRSTYKWAKLGVNPIKFSRAVDEKLKELWVEVDDPYYEQHPEGGLTVSFGGCELYPGSECTGFMFFGSTGSGKTVGGDELMDNFTDIPFIWFDVTGDCVKKRYSEARGDEVISPFDARFRGWSPWKEIKFQFSLDAIAEGLIDDPVGGDKFWAVNARIVFRDIVTRLSELGQETNERLYYWAAKAPLADLHAFLKGKHGGTLMNPDAETTAMGIRAELTSNMAIWAYLEDTEDPFSMREYIENPGAKNVFITSRGDAHAMMKPFISLLVEIFAGTLLARDHGFVHRQGFYADEFHVLPRFKSLQAVAAQGRKYGFVCVLLTQLFSQIQMTYGEKGAESLLGQFKTLFAFNMREATSTKYLSSFFGNYRMRESKTSRSNAADDARDSTGSSDERKLENLLIDGDFIRLPRLACYMASPEADVIRLRLRFKKRPAPLGNRPEFCDDNGFPLPYILRENIGFDPKARLAEMQARKKGLKNEAIPVASAPPEGIRLYEKSQADVALYGGVQKIDVLVASEEFDPTVVPPENKLASELKGILSFNG